MRFLFCLPSQQTATEIPLVELSSSQALVRKFEDYVSAENAAGRWITLPSLLTGVAQLMREHFPLEYADSERSSSINVPDSTLGLYGNHSQLNRLKENARKKKRNEDDYRKKTEDCWGENSSPCFNMGTTKFCVIPGNIIACLILAARGPIGLCFACFLLSNIPPVCDFTLLICECCFCSFGYCVYLKDKRSINGERQENIADIRREPIPEEVLSQLESFFLAHLELIEAQVDGAKESMGDLVRIIATIMREIWMINDDAALSRPAELMISYETIFRAIAQSREAPNADDRARLLPSHAMS